MGQPETSETRPPTPSRKQAAIAAFTVLAILAHLVLRYAVRASADVLGRPIHELPLLAALFFGGVPLVFGLLVKLGRREFGSDLLAGLSIVTAVLLGELLAGTL